MFQHPEPVSALGELFAEEDRALQRKLQQHAGPAVTERVEKEMALYRDLAPIPTEQDPIMWWYSMKERLPLLSCLSSSYLCIPATSTASERVFSTTGDTLSPERSRLEAERVDMMVFLKKNTANIRP